MNTKALGLFSLFFASILFTQAQDTLSKHKLFIRGANFRPDFGFTKQAQLDIPGHINILDVDPTNSPGHSFEIGINTRLSNHLYWNTSLGYWKARQVKSFLNYRPEKDLQEFNAYIFTISGQSYEHRRFYLNNSLQYFIFKGFFMESGLLLSTDVSSRKDNVTQHFFQTLALEEKYASLMNDIPRKSTQIIAFYNVSIGYSYKGFAVSVFMDRSFTEMKRNFTFNNVIYTEKQPFWKNIGARFTYTLQKQFWDMN